MRCFRFDVAGEPHPIGMVVRDRRRSSAQSLVLKLHLLLVCRSADGHLLHLERRQAGRRLDGPHNMRHQAAHQLLSRSLPTSHQNG